DPERVGSELGMVLEEAELACRQDRDQALRICTPLPGGSWSIGGASASSLEALFRDERLEKVVVYLPESRFSATLAFLSSRYVGGRDWNVVLRAGMAGRLPDRIRIWETERFVLIAQQYDGKIDRSSVIYGSAEAMTPLLRRIESTPPGGMRDL